MPVDILAQARQELPSDAVHRHRDLLEGCASGTLDSRLLVERLFSTSEDEQSVAIWIAGVTGCAGAVPALLRLVLLPDLAAESAVALARIGGATVAGCLHQALAASAQERPHGVVLAMAMGDWDNASAELIAEDLSQCTEDTREGCANRNWAVDGLLSIVMRNGEPALNIALDALRAASRQEGEVGRAAEAAWRIGVLRSLALLCVADDVAGDRASEVRRERIAAMLRDLPIHAIAKEVTLVYGEEVADDALSFLQLLAAVPEYMATHQTADWLSPSARESVHEAAVRILKRV